MKCESCDQEFEVTAEGAWNPVAYCPYCGEELDEMEEDNNIDDYDDEDFEDEEDENDDGLLDDNELDPDNIGEEFNSADDNEN
jgi:hypothetical protein